LKKGGSKRERAKKEMELEAFDESEENVHRQNAKAWKRKLHKGKQKNK